MKVALIHDWLTGMRGGERVLHEFATLYPEAHLYTLVHVPGSTTPQIEQLEIRASALSRLPGVARHYRKLLPLFPWAIRRFELKGYDVVISISHAVAKGVRVHGNTPHLCYCLTPMRYVWDQADAYLGHGPRRMLGAPLAAWLRRWDVRTSQPEQVTRFVAISETVADRIRRHYARPADVIHPPVDVQRIRPNGKPPEPFYLLVGGFVPYKREELALEAFRGLDQELWVVGDGPRRARLQQQAPRNVRFLGRVNDAELTDLYARCRALIYPQDEDFGIVAVEAQAAGRPVIAFGSGGASETVSPHPGNGSPATGVWFETQTPAALAAAVESFERLERDFDSVAIRAHSEHFSAERFRQQMAHTVEETVKAARSHDSIDPRVPNR